MQKAVASVFLTFLLLAGPAFGRDASYISLRQIDLAKLLEPSPLAQSERQARDLKAVLEAQQTRTESQSARAIADNDLSLFRIAGDVLGPNFTAARVPRTAELFNRIYQDARVIFLAAKDTWNRPRPFKASTEVKPLLDLHTNGSYPSGHAIRGYLAAIFLSNMLPEKSEALFARAREYGQNRVVAGVHYPSDVEAGRISATAMAVTFMQNKAFMKDFAKAQAELRRELDTR